MNRNGSTSDGGKKRSSASAGLKESPSKRRPIQRSYPDLMHAFSELCSITNADIDTKIKVYLFKVYEYVKPQQSPSKSAARKLDMSADDQQSAKSSNLSASEIAKLKLTDSKLDEEASSGQASGSSNDEDLSLCLQASYLDDLKKMWGFEYISVIKARNCDSDNPDELSPVIKELLRLFRKLVYLEVFVMYNGVGSHANVTQARTVPFNIDKCENLLRMRHRVIDRSEFDPEQMSAGTNEEFRVKILKLWEIEELNMYCTIEVTKYFIYRYFDDSKKLMTSQYGEFTKMADDLTAELAFVRGICTSLSQRELSKEKSDLFTYFNEIQIQIEKTFTQVIDHARNIYTFLNR